MSETLSLISLLVGLVTSVGGGIAWWRAIVRKQYAAERDFGHLKRNYQQLAQNVNAMYKESDQRFDRLDLELVELKGLLAALLARMGASESEILRSRK
ncbi:MAG: hypothetical protein F6J97_22415 [Leptolyngbya sp. SIO4C1]|nr:hypothetical protein [Leptolyngbya sp. SIO4C1]